MFRKPQQQWFMLGYQLGMPRTTGAFHRLGCLLKNASKRKPLNEAALRILSGCAIYDKLLDLYGEKQAIIGRYKDNVAWNAANPAHQSPFSTPDELQNALAFVDKKAVLLQELTGVEEVGAIVSRLQDLDPQPDMAGRYGKKSILGG